jgi:twinkle protein
VISIWRNKAKEEILEEIENGVRVLDAETLEQPDAILEIHKQRNGDWEGKLHLWFHKVSYQFIDDLDCPPQMYVEESELIEEVVEPELQVDITDWVIQ